MTHITNEEHKTIYLALESEADKLARAYKKASKAVDAAGYSKQGTPEYAFLIAREEQAKAVYRAAFEVAAKYFSNHIN